MIDKIAVLCHNCIRFDYEKIIYVDPFKLTQEYNDADIILITHSHYDHFSEEDIEKVKKDDTTIIITNDLYEKTLKLNFKKENIVVVTPNVSINVKGIKINTIPAYNVNKQFHPKANNWVGYILEIKGITYYIAGDTDVIEENKKIKCDIAFVPVRWNIYNE